MDPVDAGACQGGRRPEAPAGAQALWRTAAVHEGARERGPSVSVLLFPAKAVMLLPWLATWAAGHLRDPVGPTCKSLLSETPADGQPGQELVNATEESAHLSPFQPLPALCSPCRRGVALEIQQPGMQRRIRNGSRWEGGSARHLAWRIEWDFPAADFNAVDKK